LFWSFVYLVVRNLFALVWLLGRPRRSKELEILVRRHELTILRRQAAWPMADPSPSRAAGSAEPLATTGRLDRFPGEAGNAVALAPPAGRPPLDVEG
jgi:hypothetical protein